MAIIGTKALDMKVRKWVGHDIARQMTKAYIHSADQNHHLTLTDTISICSALILHRICQFKHTCPQVVALSLSVSLSLCVCVALSVFFNQLESPSSRFTNRA